jgi:hypothetical protein
MQSPKKEVSADAHKAYRETRINLEALYDAADPFSTPLRSASDSEEASGSVSGQYRETNSFDGHLFNIGDLVWIAARRSSPSSRERKA